MATTQKKTAGSTGETGGIGEIVLPSAQKGINNKILVLLLFLPCLVVTLTMDNDIWFLLNSGRYVLAHGIPTIEPFTLHESFQFLMQQWLSAVLFWGIFEAMGPAGVIALVFLVFCATVAVVYLHARLLSGGNHIASFLAAIITSAALKPAMVSRPMIFTMLILVCELYFLERFIRSEKPAWLLPLPVLSALLINLHAAMWPIQFIILLPYMIDSFRFKLWCVEGQGFPKRYFFPAVGLMALAGFLNPYGRSAMTYVFRSYGFSEIGMVLEMQPADINQLSGMLIFGLFLLILAVYLLKKERKTRLRYVLLPLGTAVLALSSVRSFALFAACGVVPLAYVLQDVTLPEGKIKTQRGVLRLRAVLVALVALTLCLLVSQRVHTAIEKGQEPLVASAIDYLLQHESTEDMVLYAGYNEGGFAEFKGLKPYIDPRAEVFVEKNNRQKDVMKEYRDLQYGLLYYRDMLDEYGFTHLLVSRDDLLSTYLPHDEDYRLVYEDDTYFIYRRG
jgi:hypothetical protein